MGLVLAHSNFQFLYPVSLYLPADRSSVVIYVEAIDSTFFFDIEFLPLLEAMTTKSPKTLEELAGEYCDIECKASAIIDSLKGLGLLDVHQS